MIIITRLEEYYQDRLSSWVRFHPDEVKRIFYKDAPSTELVHTNTYICDSHGNVIEVNANECPFGNRGADRISAEQTGSRSYKLLNINKLNI